SAGRGRGGRLPAARGGGRAGRASTRDALPPGGNPLGARDLLDAARGGRGDRARGAPPAGPAPNKLNNRLAPEQMTEQSAGTCSSTCGNGPTIGWHLRAEPASEPDGRRRSTDGRRQSAGT